MRASIFKKIILFNKSWYIVRFELFNQQDATVSQVYCLTFTCGLTCFQRLPAHHQELTPALGASDLTVGEWQPERCWS
jgi:hypothetical protein